MDKLDPRSTALVLIDLQKGILPLARGPYGTDTVLRNAAALAHRARALGMPVVLVSVGWSAGYGDMLRQPVDQPIAVPPDALPADWTELAPELARQPGDIPILKRQWNAFHGTELDLQLRRRGIATILLGGISTNLGVESTARAAWEHGYAVVLAEDACSAVHGDAAHRFSIETIMPRISRVRRSADILSALAA
ncbi:hydrolase [uncultured Ferrovibrio sp.]|uniref:hydrolase n=1 Tax=uncultured Ferrovibrio sp. TaxID=1576913 RepID=UPI00262F14E1|nr:hydrolase [uncultured Ferrovibrio sp.]